ncbi:hypothetical protein ANO14919_088180 [Xylariales sp. No.14919]|nr:hypothetical protein ANO14919_088180 [Xylariales sp. No.14919]
MPVVPGACWDLLDRTAPPVKRRATHAKARTGCLTCKRRKVKCDEARPACARCLKSGHPCAGYEDARKPAHAGNVLGVDTRARAKHPGKPAPAHVLLRPKPVPAPGLGIVGAAAKAEGGLDLVRASLTPRYLDARDALYFERFRSQMLVDLGVWCGAAYWRHTILREVLLDETVRHGALAAAAMLMDLEEQFARGASLRKGRPRSGGEELGKGGDKGVVVDGSGSATGSGSTIKCGREDEEDDEEEETLPVVPLSQINAHGKAALRHYTTSISLCRATLGAEGITAATARSSLTATFFFAVFELVQGNVGEADRILSSGVALLDNAFSSSSSSSSPALVADDELRQIQLAFDRMRVTWGLCPYFGARGRGQGRGHASAPSASNGAPAPPTRHFELPSPDASVRTKQAFWNAFSSEFGAFMVRVQSGPTPIPADALPAILAQRAHYLVQLRHWLPILSDLCARDPGSALLGTTKVYAQTAVVFLNCFLDPAELAYDAYLPVFQDIVSTYERLFPPSQQQQHPQTHQHQNKNQQQEQRGGGGGDHLRLTLDVDLFHIITFTVSKCRHRGTRRAALRVFARMTRRQALWTNRGMLAALRALADLEDRGSDDDDGAVPASARYTYVDSEWDFPNRRMQAVFVPVLAPPGGGGGDDDGTTVRVPIRF